MENLSFTQVSEEKDVDGRVQEDQLPPKMESVPSESVEKEEVPAKSMEEGDGKEETGVKEDEECIPDDKRDIPVAPEQPTVLTVLSTAPRDNVVT